MTEENVRLGVAAELGKGRQDLESAARIAQIGELTAALNRLYYAAYHVAYAVCLSQGVEPKTHRGLTHLLRLHFIDARLLPKWVEPLFSTLQTTRDLADYEPTFQVTAQKYDDARTDASKLIAELEGYLRAKGFIT